jgi:hypothetical protein
MICKHCGHDTDDPVTRSVVVDQAERPVAAPCAISGCQFDELVGLMARLESELDRLRVGLSAEVVVLMPPKTDRLLALRPFRVGVDTCPTCGTTGKYDCPACGIVTRAR